MLKKGLTGQHWANTQAVHQSRHAWDQWTKKNRQSYSGP